MSPHHYKPTRLQRIELRVLQIIIKHKLRHMRAEREAAVVIKRLQQGSAA